MRFGELRDRWLTALLALALSVAGALAAAAAGAEAPRNWRISFEVLSSLHAQPPEGRKASYAEKEQFTRAALAQIVPHVWTTLGAVAQRARSRVRAGGYHDRVNPSIHSNITTTEGEARRLAAALGYVFRQYAVLVYDLRNETGTLRYVSVLFPRGTLTPALAEEFFAKARARLNSEKLGFSATYRRMIFINLNTGIPDDAFAAGLVSAARDLPDAKIEVEPIRPVRATLLENDWDKAREGEDYARLFGPNGGRIAAALAQLRRRHDGRVRRWVQFLR